MSEHALQAGAVGSESGMCEAQHIIDEVTAARWAGP